MSLCDSTEGFGLEAQHFLVAVIVISCICSIIGSFLIIFSYCLWEDIRSPLRSLIVYLSIADLFTATGNLTGLGNNLIQPTDPVLCLIQSYVTTSASICSFLWTMCIALYLYLVIRKKHVAALRAIYVFHILCWGVPLFLVSFAMGFNALGEDNYSETVGWCWINNANLISWPYWENKSRAIFWKILVGKGIEFLSYIFTPIIYIISKRALQSDRLNQQLLLNTTARVRATIQDTDRKLVLIPIVFLFFRIWGSVRWLTSMPCPGFLNLYAMALMQGLGDSAQGWANCLLFCVFTTKIRLKFKDLFMDHCCKKGFNQYTTC